MNTELYLPQTETTISDYNQIQQYLNSKKVFFQRWNAQFELNTTDDQQTVLDAYQHELKPFMQKNGFVSADVINISRETPNIEQIRQKFLKEHTHSEDEVRFFVDGSGVFWFHFDDGAIAKLTCTRGDFLSVPKNFRHWFDIAPSYFVKAIRIFSNQEGWVANYTGSGVDEKYIKDSV